jgi:two-component system, OmpR family, phosphate regulon sensor histidine kinase PhoR
VLHEVRSPLTVVIANAEWLARRRLDVDSMDTVQVIVSEAARLDQILDDWSALMLHPESEPPGEAFDLAALVLESVAEHTRVYASRPITINAGAMLPLAEGSRSWTQQILRNLISNAEKYSAPDQPIDIALSLTAPGELGVRVRDRGVGLPEDPEVLFIAFHRAEAARTMAPGMGIGLTASRRLAEAQGGRIWAQHRAGGGSDFAFTVRARGRGGQ